LNHKENSILAIFYLEYKYKGVRTYLNDYLAMMPKFFKNFPIFFTQKDKEFLKGTKLLEMIDKERKEIMEDFDMICKEVPELNGHFTLKEFAEAMMIVKSRAV